MSRSLLLLALFMLASCASSPDQAPGPTEVTVHHVQVSAPDLVLLEQPALNEMRAALKTEQKSLVVKNGRSTQGDGTIKINRRDMKLLLDLEAAARKRGAEVKDDRGPIVVKKSSK